MPTYPLSLPLVNPGAENGVTGWTSYSGGAPGVLTNPGAGSGGDGLTHSGTYSFVATTNGTSAIWGQTVAVPADQWGDIDAGLYWVSGRVWLKTWPGDEDYGRLNVMCLDATGKTIAMASSRWICGSDTWREEAAVCAVPVGTRQIMIQTESVRVSGTELSVYFDDFTLQLIAPPNLARDVPHRHWLFVCDANNGDTYCTINELKWFNASGSEITGGTYTVHQFLTGYPGSGLNDGGSTLWAGDIRRGHAWANYDLGAGNSAAPLSFSILTRPDGYPAQAPKDFRILWSDDGVEYYPAANFFRATAWGSAETRRFRLTNDRYRIRYYQGVNATYFAELELRGSIGGADLTVPCGPTTGLGGFCFGDAGNGSVSVAFDGLVNDNYIGTTASGRFVEWHFDTPTELNEISLSARSGYGVQAPSDLYIERSIDNGFTYRPYGYVQSGTFTNGQTKVLPISKTNIFVSKVGEYVVEGGNGITASKVGEYVVEGAPTGIQTAKVGEYVVEGSPTGIFASKVGYYVVEGPPSSPFGPFVDQGGHRYWRLYMRRAGSNGRYTVGVTDIQFRRGDGRNIVGFGGTAIGSSQQSSSQSYAMAFDGIDSTIWQVDNTTTTVSPYGHGQWIGYDFGDGWTPRLDEIVILPNKDDLSRTPVFFEIQYSDDGNSWATDWGVMYRGGYSLGIPVSFTRPVFTTERTARYWALQPFALAGPSYTNVGGSEFHIMNEEDGTSLVQGRTTGGFTSGNAGSENVHSLFDGNNNTIWSAATPGFPGGDYLGYDFGSPIEVRQFTWRSRTDSSTLWQQSPVSGQWWRSEDGTNFVPMWQFSGLNFTGGGQTQTAVTPLPPENLVRGRRRNGVTVVF